MARDSDHLAKHSWFSLLIPSGGVMKDAQSRLEAAYRSISEESLRFLNKRHEHNSQTIERYCDVKEPASFLQAQHDWATDVLHDYAEGAGRMVEAIYRCFSDTREKKEKAQ